MIRLSSDEKNTRFMAVIVNTNEQQVGSGTLAVTAPLPFTLARLPMPAFAASDIIRGVHHAVMIQIGGQFIGRIKARSPLVVAARL